MFLKRKMKVCQNYYHLKKRGYIITYVINKYRIYIIIDYHLKIAKVYVISK